ncbi:hypothetical protein CAOG_009554 [Capsaspora owczarzaki ATCC 30864]|uniref:Aminoacyl-transfer RNA synthetases class-II family profile domain-containing protein n=1 Tax=Capsaspora owczarzaki (strain ATCC 30864) TaxID=595528 RepID=A0A0D2VMG2_CAPO3|nr:hypothetical protein CAOG_009554 [Capsaspora owczarzaki ATCC 30864]
MVRTAAAVWCSASAVVLAFAAIHLNPTRSEPAAASANGNHAAVKTLQHRASQPHDADQQLNDVYRSHTCGAVAKANAESAVGQPGSIPCIGDQVKVAGWLEFKRLVGDNVFLSIRDIHGSVQVVFRQEDFVGFTEVRALIDKLPKQSVVSISGIVTARPQTAVTEASAVEIAASSLVVLNRATLVPFDHQQTNVSEELRQQHRYYDLRNPKLQHSLQVRSKVTQVIRSVLADEGFLEVETPTLFKRTPEGAREFLVPTRTPGQFFALPQSPQQYKQMLMVAGVDKYFQFARCYRDEDLRADRQPEFTQLDMEMSFIRPIDIQNVIEKIVARAWLEVHGMKLELPFRRMPYQEAMEQYGIDKPDTRFGMKLQNLQACKELLSQASVARGFRVQVPESLRSPFKKALPRLIKELALRNAVTKPFNGLPAALEDATLAQLDLVGADFVCIATGDHAESVLQRLGKLRLAVAAELERLGHPLRNPNEFHFLWVEDFPLFTESDTAQAADGTMALEATHHPFTAPHPNDAHLVFTDPRKVRGLHYDIVVNGWELGGGSIRIHDSDMQERLIREVLGADITKFSHLLKALRTGAPPHGGIALGFDRMMAILLSARSLREVIAFPKAFSGRDLTCEAPSAISDKDLADYGLKLIAQPDTKL